MKLAGTQATGKLGLNGWVTALNDDNERADLWFFARKGARLVMDFDRAVAWRTPGDDGSSAASGQTPNGVSATVNAWSGPVRHLDIAADQKPWNVLVRLSPEHP